MVVFLISLRHKDSAKDFTTVEYFLSLTLQSICGQTDGNFKVIVVCNEKPNVAFHDERVHFHVVNFPAPLNTAPAESKEVVAPKFVDKGTKYMSGLLYAKQFSPSHVFILDSDDWVNINLVKYLHSQPKQPVWYVNKGYFVNFPSKEYKRRSGLCRYCGSTFIYDYDFLMKQANLAKPVTENSSQEELIAASSEFFVLRLLSNHTINYRHFKKLGYLPKAIPMRTSCWIQGTGENISGTAGGNAGVAIDKTFCKTFNLPDTLINNKQANITNKLRDILAGMNSSYSWYKSKKSSENKF